MTERAVKRLAEGEINVSQPVIIDTETSGLYADDGARVSTVSIAFESDENQTELLRKLGFTVKRERFIPHGDEDPDAEAWCASIALPFDQGREGKPEGHGQDPLWSDAPNLGAASWQRLLRWLGEQELVFHNAKFDLEKMRVGIRQGRFGELGVGIDLEEQFEWDTQLACRKLWPLGPDPKTGFPTSSLKPTCERYWGPEATLEADAIKQYLRNAKLPPGRYDLIPWDILGPYADQDARLTWKLYWWQQVWLARMPTDNADELNEDIQREFTTMRTLYRMEKRGVPYDSARSMDASHALTGRAKAAIAALPFYPPTIAAAKKFYFGDENEWRQVAKRGEAGLELAPYSTTPTGAAQMTAETTDKMVLDGVAGIDRWAELQKINTADSMWYIGYANAVGQDGRLRTCFRQAGTASTRFSVERVNLQAIPHDYRLEGFKALEGLPTPRALIASAVAKDMPGWSLWELDLAQAELRVAAMWAECYRMLDAIREGRDLHGETTIELFGVEPGDPEWGHYRQIGKRGNFTLCFGAGAQTFRGMVAKETGKVLDLGEAQDIVESWNALYPEYRRTIRRHADRVDSRIAKHGYGWMTLVNGVKRYWAYNEGTHKAFNQRVQGSLAQYAVDWMNRTERYLSSTKIQKMADRDGIGGVGLLLVIHDSQVLLLPDESGEFLARNCAAMGEELWKNWFPGVPGAIDLKKWKG